MKLDKCIEYINNEALRGSVYNLDAINLLLDRLERPENSLKIIHIAGTNGKGSVSNYLTNILSTTYKVGTFNSPQVFSFNECFLINGNPCFDEDLENALSKVIEEVELMRKENIQTIPTSFEIQFAAALYLFRELALDFAIIECGMGGLNDATNAMQNKLLSIITSISLDHTDYLGDTLSLIAEEKLGICTKYLITGYQDEEVMKVLKKAKRLIVAKKPNLMIANSSGQTFKYKLDTFKIQMQGAHQLDNASIAICATHLLRRWGYKISKDNLKKGLFVTKFAGRCEKINCQDKLFIIDGAHNESGVNALHNIIKNNYLNKKKSYVFACFKDKDYNKMLSIMQDNANIYIAKAPTNRGLDVIECKNICEKYFNNVITNTSISQAIINAYNEDSEIVIIFGSLSILSEARDCIRGIINGQIKN